MNILIRFSLISFLAVSQFAFGQGENDAAYRFLEQLEMRYTNERDWASSEQMRAALGNVLYHPVATLKDYRTVNKYDPTGAIGFCFGRAMATHNNSRLLGLRPEAVKKIFVIGDMRSGAEPEWRFHVTTIVRGKNGQWYALDPITPGGRVVTAEAWLSWVRQTWDSHNFSKFKTNAYITSGDVVIPNLKVSPPATEINNTDIMSTSFQPETHEGVKKVAGIERLYDVSVSEAADFQKRQFISHNEIGTDRYDMAKITINGSATYEYAGYFRDLLNTTLEFAKSSGQTGGKLLSSMVATTRIWQDRLRRGLFAMDGFTQESAARRAANQVREVTLEDSIQRRRAGADFRVIEGDIDLENCLR